MTSQPYRRPDCPTVIPYLLVKNAPAMIVFLREVFGAELMLEHHYDDGAIMYAAVRIDESVIELSEARPEWPERPATIHIYVPDCDAVHAAALERKAVEQHPPTDQEYGERSSAFTDPFGNQWFPATMLST